METSPSIRKQFLTKIYKRSAERSRESSFFEEMNSGVNQNSSFSSQKSETGKSWTSSPSKEKRSGTPGVQRRESPNKESMNIFVDFLTELLNSQGVITEHILKEVYLVTKALNDNFAKNPEFSLQFYISMSEILNALNDVDTLNFPELQIKIEDALALTNEGITEIEQLTSLKKHISKINLRVVTTLKRFLTVKDDIQNLSYAFLVLFSQADKDIEVSSNKKIPATSVLGIMQKYTLMPGKMIQTCRKVVEFIQKKMIPSASVRSASEILGKVNQQVLMEIDRSGGLLIFYDFLRACFTYFWAYNQQGPKRSFSPNSSLPETKIVEVDEDDVGEVRPPPVKIKLRPVYEQKVLERTESTKSVNGKEEFEGIIEERFKKFLRGTKMIGLDKLENRLAIIDEFEKEIRMEIREAFLDIFENESILKQEIEKSKLNQIIF